MKDKCALGNVGVDGIGDIGDIEVNVKNKT